MNSLHYIAIFLNIFSLILLLNACHATSLLKQGDNILWQKNKTTIVAFLATDCPISQQMSLYLRNIAQQHDSSQLRILLVFQPKATIEQVNHFLHTYQLHLPYCIDRSRKLAKSLSAQITPEVFLYDNQKKLRYYGAINDLYINIGNKRPSPRQHFLQANTDSLLRNAPLPFTHQTAIGCYIETK